jgi:hypothetical protein
MTEQELIEEGFERVEVPKWESGDKSSYYYYKLDLNPHFTFISNANDEVYNKTWKVTCFEIDVIIKDIVDLQTLIALNKKWSKNK